MFHGEHEHALGATGRLTLPSRFREELGGTVVLTKGHDHCLYLFPGAAWESEAKRVLALSRSLRENRNTLRAFFAAATTEEVDAQGRILVPASLRSYAELGSRVVVAGSGDRVEIWNESSWSRTSAKVDAEYGGDERVREDRST